MCPTHTTRTAHRLNKLDWPAIPRAELWVEQTRVVFEKHWVGCAVVQGLFEALDPAPRVAVPPPRIKDARAGFDHEIRSRAAHILPRPAKRIQAPYVVWVGPLHVLERHDVHHSGCACARTFFARTIFASTLVPRRAADCDQRWRCRGGGGCSCSTCVCGLGKRCG